MITVESLTEDFFKMKVGEMFEKRAEFHPFSKSSKLDEISPYGWYSEGTYKFIRKVDDAERDYATRNNIMFLCFAHKKDADDFMSSSWEEYSHAQNPDNFFDVASSSEMAGEIKNSIYSIYMRINGHRPEFCIFPTGTEAESWQYYCPAFRKQTDIALQGSIFSDTVSAYKDKYEDGDVGTLHVQSDFLPEEVCKKIFNVLKKRSRFYYVNYKDQLLVASDAGENGYTVLEYYSKAEEAVCPAYLKKNLPQDVEVFLSGEEAEKLSNETVLLSEEDKYLPHPVCMRIWVLNPNLSSEAGWYADKRNKDKVQVRTIAESIMAISTKQADNYAFITYAYLKSEFPNLDIDDLSSKSLKAMDRNMINQTVDSILLGEVKSEKHIDTSLEQKEQDEMIIEAINNNDISVSIEDVSSEIETVIADDVKPGVMHYDDKKEVKFNMIKLDEISIENVNEISLEHEAVSHDFGNFEERMEELYKEEPYDNDFENTEQDFSNEEMVDEITEFELKEIQENKILEDDILNDETFNKFTEEIGEAEDSEHTEETVKDNEINFTEQLVKEKETFELAKPVTKEEKEQIAELTFTQATPEGITKVTATVNRDLNMPAPIDKMEDLIKETFHDSNGKETGSTYYEKPQGHVEHKKEDEVSAFIEYDGRHTTICILKIKGVQYSITINNGSKKIVDTQII